ncbi:MAG: hypothetical protein WBL74_05795 [Novosphingobium sp.]|uniref:hypothetical protein n=1 Tax=Novosphingobium sp. TaxID=1874826 RepID=UPI003C798B43
MTVLERARRGWIICLAGTLIGAALIALRNPQALSGNVGVLLIFGLTCWLFSLLRPKWGAIVFGGIAAVVTALGYNWMQSSNDGAGMAGVMFVLIGVQTAMATLVSVLGNLVLDRLGQPRGPDSA